MSQDNGPKAPPGYYDTPAGRKWWDGDQWLDTDAVTGDDASGGTGIGGDDDVQTPSESEADEAPSKRSKSSVGGLIFLMLWLIAGFVFTTDFGSSGSSGEGSDRDVLAMRACRDFRSAVSDMNAGILLPSELREEFDGVASRARSAEEPGMPEAGRELLRSVTTGTDAELADAVLEFNRRCSSAGY